MDAPGPVGPAWDRARRNPHRTCVPAPLMACQVSPTQRTLSFERARTAQDAILDAIKQRPLLDATARKSSLLVVTLGDPPHHSRHAATAGAKLNSLRSCEELRAEVPRVIVVWEVQRATRVASTAFSSFWSW